MLSVVSSPVHSLYVHVPFCAQKCSYCAFFSDPATKDQMSRYVAALVRELELIAADLQPRTVFFGGGTPSLLNHRQWEEVFEAMDRLKLLGAAEFTVECNPATVSLDKARLLKEHGVNRISMGVQSLDEALLERLGRVHSREMVFKSFDTLRRAGFDNVNVDLMFAIPGQSLEIWQETLTEAVALESEHLSSYEVIYEEDTALYAQLQAGEFAVDEDLSCAMYEALISRATTAGFHQYEIANFARHASESGTRTGRLETGKLPAFACRHNVNYWRGGDFHGVGPAATGYVRGVRSKNWSNTQLYCEQLERGRRAIESSECLPPLARAGEIAAFGLRMPAGWAFEEFYQTTGFDLRNEWETDMDELITRGWACRDAERFQLTAAGLRFADAAAEMFLRPGKLSTVAPS